VTSGGNPRPFVSPAICHSCRGAGSRSKKTRSRRESAGNETEARTEAKTRTGAGLNRAGTRDPVCSCWKSELGSERAARPAGLGGSVKDRSSRGWGGLSGPSQFLVWIESRGQAGLVNLISELIRPSCSWIQFDLIGAKPPSGRLVLMSARRAPRSRPSASVALLRSLPEAAPSTRRTGFISSEVSVSRRP
jgi:hypothetical protein